jgi:hypothetical protein
MAHSRILHMIVQCRGLMAVKVSAIPAETVRVMLVCRSGGECRSVRKYLWYLAATNRVAELSATAVIGALIIAALSGVCQPGHRHHAVWMGTTSKQLI